MKQSEIPFHAFKYHSMAYDSMQYALGDSVRASDLIRSYKYTSNSVPVMHELEK